MTLSPPVRHVLYNATGKIVSVGATPQEHINSVLQANPTYGVLYGIHATFDDHVDLSGPEPIVIRWTPGGG